jgi:hypothetical protein
MALSLARPGLNVTGVALLQDQLFAKHIELMREILPRLTKVGMLVDRASGDCRVVEARGAAHHEFSVQSLLTIESLTATRSSRRPDVLLPCPAALLFNNRGLHYDNAVRLRIPFTSFVTANLPLAGC